jgi:hypothetical protein
MARVNPLATAAGEIYDYLGAKVMQATNTEEELRQREQAAVSSMIENEKSRRELAARFPMSTSAQNFQQTDGLWNALTEEGGVGNALSAVVESTGESLIRSAPALAATVATRGRGAAGIMLADTAAQEYSAGVMDYLSSTFPGLPPEQLEDKLLDPAIREKAISYAKARAGASGLGSFAGVKAAGAILPGPGATTGQFARNVLVTQPATQLGLDAGTETIAQLASRGSVDTKDVFLEAAGGAISAPVDVAGQVLGRMDANRKAEEQRILEAKERARRLNTPTAENLANSFERGVREAAANSPEQLNLELTPVEDVVPNVGGAVEIETQRALERELEARQPEPVAPLNRLSREADQLRGTIETAAENPAALNEVEQANVADNIDRLNEVESRMANIDRAPEQGDLFNVVTDPNVQAIEDTRRKIAESDAKSKAKAEEKELSRRAAEVRKFRTDFIRNNPAATNEEVLAAESEWQRTRTAPVTKATSPAAKLPAAPQVKPEDTSEGLNEDVLKILRTRRVGPKAAADLDGITVDEGTQEFDPIEIEEADVRELAQKNPNLRQHLAGTAVRPVLYHGTRKDADIGVWEVARNQLGVHMSAAPDGVPAQFAARDKSGGKIVRLAVNVKNPVRLRDDGNWGVLDVVPQLTAMGKLGEERSAFYRQQFANLARQIDAANSEQEIDALSKEQTDLATEAVKEAGYDGVVYQNRYEVPGLTDEQVAQRLLDNGIRPDKEGRSKLSDNQFKALFPETDLSVIALDSNQVKDIDNNVGSTPREDGEGVGFDTTNPNIKAAAEQDVTNYREYRANLADKTEAFPPMSAERRLVEAHATATTPAKRIAAAFDFIDDTLGDSANDAFLRKFVVPALRRLAPLIKDVVIFPDVASLRYNGGTAKGLFFPDTGKIQIARNGMNARVMIHEMLHAATWGALRNPKFVAANPDVAAAVAGINKVRDLVQAWVKDGGVDRLPPGIGKDYLQSGKGRMIDEKGNVDIDELITYIFTIPEAAAALREVKAPGMLRNAWRTTVNAVRQMLGLKADQMDVVDVILTEGVELLNALAVAGNAPTSRDTINTTDYRKRGEGTLDMAADVAAKASPEPVPPAPTADIATRLVSARGVAGIGGDKATGKNVGTKRNAISSAIGKWTRGSRGLAPEAVVEVLVNEEGMTAAGVIELREQYLDMRKLVADNASKFFSKKSDHWEKFVTMMDRFENAKTDEEKATRGEEIRNIFGERALEILEDMRTKIDQRSMELIERLYEDAPRDSDGNVVLSKDLTRQLNAIAANIGKYNHRSYAIFDKELGKQHRLWLESTGPGRQVYDAAVAYVAKNDVHIPEDKVLNKMSREALERRAAVWVTSTPGLPLEDLRARLVEVRDNPQAYNPDAITDNALKMVEDILDNKTTPATRFYLSERADQSVLKKRENVPAELRKLMGENADPGFRVLQTVLKQDQLLNKLRAFREIADRFSGTYVYDNRNDAPAGFVALNGENLGALAGKFVHPDVAAVLETQSVTMATIDTMFDNAQNLTAYAAEKVGTAARLMKGGLLLFNGMGYAFNLAGSFATILANGHVGKLVTEPTLLKEAIQTIIENNVALAGGRFTPRVEEMFRRVINDPAMTGEMQQMSFQDAINRVYEREAVDNARTKFAKATDKIGWAWDRMFDTYAAMDLWAKIFNYYAEVAEIRAFNDTLPANQKLDEEGIRRTAAERVRQSNLSYERAVPAARSLDRVGVSMFATYTTEVFRSLGAGASLVNSDLQLAKEMETEGNAEAATFLRKSAAKRASGILGVTVAGSLVGKGITTTVLAGLQMLGFLAAADYDEEEEEAIIATAKAGSPWMENRDVGVAGKDPKTGMPVVIDYGRGNPYDPAANSMRLLAEGKVSESLLTTLGGVSPLVAWAADINGQFSRIPRTVREGGIVADAVAKADARGLVSRGTSQPLINLLEIYAPTQAEAAVIEGDMTMNDAIGYRPVLADPLKLLGRGGIGRNVADERNRFRDNLLRPNVLSSDGDVEAMLAGVVAKELELYRKASVSLRLARDLGIPEKDIKTAVEDSSLRKDAARGLLRENFVPSILSEEVLNAAKETAIGKAETAAERTEINARFRFIKRRLSELRRQALLEESN